MTTAENPSVICPAGDDLLLFRAGRPDAVLIDANVALPEKAVFAVPTDAVRLTVIDVAPEEAKHLSKSLPFMLEDEVLEDVELLHFASKPLGDGKWLVAVVSRENMAHWEALLPDDWQGAWIPDVLLLPWQSGDLCVVIEQETALVRYGEWQGCRIEHGLLSTLIEALPNPPTSVVLYGKNEFEDKALLPDEVANIAQWRQGNLATALMLSDVAAVGFELRQGAFAPRLPLTKWWSIWRTVAIAASVALVLQFAADLVQYQRLKAENLALRSAIQASYRQVNPRGAVVDVEKQLNRQIAEFDPASGGSAFTPMLADIVAAVASDGGISISTLNFSGAGGEVRLDLVAEDYASVESLRRRLESQGLVATLETSSSRDDQVRARLRVEGRA